MGIAIGEHPSSLELILIRVVDCVLLVTYELCLLGVSALLELGG